MNRVLVVLMTVAALMGAVFVSGAAGHTFKAESTVSVKFDKPKPNDPYAKGGFEGNVSSTKARCERKRSVTVLQRTATGDAVVGTDVTDVNGAWQVTPSGTVAPGDYYAQVAKRVIRKNTKHRHVCRAAVSKDVTVK